MYAMAPVSLSGLRRSDPDRPRPYRLPAAKVLAPLSFVCANLVVYWSGWNTLFWLYAAIIVVFVAFAAYQRLLHPEHRLSLDARAAAWILPWLAGIGVISYLGQFPSSPPKSGWAFSLVLTPAKAIPFWWDLAAVAAFSLAVYYAAVRLAQPRERVAEAIAAVEEEIAGEPGWMGQEPPPADAEPQRRGPSAPART